MSAPLVVNTADGMCWTRRAVTSHGIALYAPESVKTCPDFVMATLDELAGRGIVGSAFVVPAPVGPEPVVRPLAVDEAQVDALVASGNRAVNDAIHEDLCACDAWPEKCLSSGGFFQGYWDMGGLATAIPAVLGLWESMRGCELERLRARVAELEAERHSTNESLSEAAEQLRREQYAKAVLEVKNLAGLFADVRAHVDPVMAVADAEQAELRARVAELEALAGAAREYRLDEPGYGLLVRRAPGPDRSGWAVLESRRTEHGRRAWTTSGWSHSVAAEELFCWPSAEVAVAEARRVMPGAVVRDEDDVTPQVERLRTLLAGQREQAGGPDEWCTGCNTDHNPDECGYRPGAGGAS